MNVLLGVTGGIAAYKAAALVSLLKKGDFDVFTVMTSGAKEFVSPLTFETLSQNPVADNVFSREHPYEVEHISLAQKTDVAVIAPASANTIAKLAHGIADNMLTTVFLALKCPIIIAPAMNTAMYENIATIENLKTLEKRGYIILPTKSGKLACGDIGFGRMCEPEEIFESILSCFSNKKLLSGKKVLITAGPTREAIDPVRYLTNRSSGKMGYALAKKAAEMGAEVTLISGPVNIKTPNNVKVIDVLSANDMYVCAKAEKEEKDVIIACAAVSDYTPAEVEKHKMKKTDELTIHLKKTVDILAELGKNKDYYLVGFAAETRDLEKYATEKLARKNLNMIVANDVSGNETGFESDYNAVSIYKNDDSKKLIPKATKENIAQQILAEIAKELT